MAEKITEAMRFEYDTEVRNTYGIFCGVDEAGRGPLAGDVYAAAVILDPENMIQGLNDSKKLSEKKRELLFDEIKEKSIAWAIATASIEEIEQINILNAALLAMKKAIEKLEIKPELALIDGNKIPKGLEIETKAVVHGDAVSASVGAASILAKVARDRYMLELAKKYPQYGFEKHKGYGTKEHREAIKLYGACPIHRMSFLKKILDESK